jgi:hypothetical protein
VAARTGGPLSVFTSAPGRTRSSPRREMDVAQFFRALRDPGEPNPPYLVGSTANVHGKGTAPVDLDEVERPGYFSPKDLLNAAFYCGRRSFSSLHFHPHGEAMACQIRGGRRFLLFGPEEYDALYAPPFYADNPHISRIPDPAQADLARFPRFRRARAWVADVKEGEALYIPIHWWHAVYGADEVAVQVTFFWRARFTAMIAPPHGRLRHLLSLVTHRHRRQQLWRDLRDFANDRGPDIRALARGA